MNYEERHVALVGRPNVGKSQLFNKILGKRLSIVHDEPGVTRDVVTGELDGRFVLMDTGGLGLVVEKKLEAIRDASEEAVDFALRAAQLIFFVVDARAGCLPLDIEIAKRLRRGGKPIFLVINKIDDIAPEAYLGEFSRLGFKNVYCVSAQHGHNIANLIEAMEAALGPRVVEAPKEGPDRIAISFMGRPNVGKSSIMNAILNTDRLIVSEVAGTTRDTIALDLDYASHSGKLWPFRLHDTAGLRSRPKQDTAVEYFSSVRTEAALQDSDIIFLVLDAMQGVTKQDKLVAGHALEVGRALIILVNKWDYALNLFEQREKNKNKDLTKLEDIVSLAAEQEEGDMGVHGYEDERSFRAAFEESVRRELFFLPDATIVFISAKTKYSIDRILRSAQECHQRLSKQLPTGPLNRCLHKCIDRHTPHYVGNRRFKLYYAVHTSVKPYTIRVFCNDTKLLEHTYERYLAQHLRTEFNLQGCPIVFDLVGRQPPK